MKNFLASYRRACGIGILSLILGILVGIPDRALVYLAMLMFLAEMVFIRKDLEELSSET